MTSIVVITISIILGYIGTFIDGALGDGSGNYFAIIGFCIPSIFILSKLYDWHQKNNK